MLDEMEKEPLENAVIYGMKGMIDHLKKYTENVNMKPENQRYIIDLMEEADETYFRILTFTDFFEETLNHMNDIRYQTLWKLYDEIIHDAELKRAGDVIFVSDGPGHEKEGLKQNKGRQTLCRYNALLANKPLMCKVLGKLD